MGFQSLGGPARVCLRVGAFRAAAFLFVPRSKVQGTKGSFQGSFTLKDSIS